MKTILCLLLLLCTGPVMAEDHTEYEPIESNASTREEACNDMKSYAIKQGAKRPENCTCREDEGWYFCKIPKLVKDDTKTAPPKDIAKDDLDEYISTAGAPSRDDACKEAQSMASKGGHIIGECNCEMRGKAKKTHICRVRSFRPMQAEPQLSKIKLALREKFKAEIETEFIQCVNACEVNEPKGIERKMCLTKCGGRTRNASFGVRD